MFTMYSMTAAEYLGSALLRFLETCKIMLGKCKIDERKFTTKNKRVLQWVAPIPVLLCFSFLQESGCYSRKIKGEKGREKVWEKRERGRERCLLQVEAFPRSIASHNSFPESLPCGPSCAGMQPTHPRSNLVEPPCLPKKLKNFVTYPSREPRDCCNEIGNGDSRKRRVLLEKRKTCQ